MTSLDSLITSLMRRVRRELYAGRPDKSWYQQQETVKKALAYPAAWLDERKVPMSAERYGQILGGILDLVRDHANHSRILFPGAYLLDCVQKHMAHHGDGYYYEGKGCRNRVTLEMAAIERHVAAHRSSADVVPALAQVHAALALGKSKGRPKAQPAPQPDLFSPDFSPESLQLSRPAPQNGQIRVSPSQPT